MVALDNHGCVFTHVMSQEVNHEYKDLNLDLGKVTGQSRWDFEFQHCGIEDDGPPWWCPTEPDDSSAETEPDLFSAGVDINRPPQTSAGILRKALYDMDLDEEEELKNSTWYRISSFIFNFHFVGPQWYQDTSHSNILPSVASQEFVGTTASKQGCAPGYEDGMEVEHVLVDPPTRIKPGQLGLQLEPREWPDPSSIRPPQIRASLLLGWHCIQCGRLNPRVEWIAPQTCPVCKARVFSCVTQTID